MWKHAHWRSGLQEADVLLVALFQINVAIHTLKPPFGQHQLFPVLLIVFRPLFWGFKFFQNAQALKCCVYPLWNIFQAKFSACWNHFGDDSVFKGKCIISASSYLFLKIIIKIFVDWEEALHLLEIILLVHFSCPTFEMDCVTSGLPLCLRLMCLLAILTVLTLPAI